MIANILSFLFISSTPIQVAVIDTGYNYNINFNASLCKNGHRDFTNDQKYEDGVPVDMIGHGSNVAGLIHQYATGINLNDSLTDFDKIQQLRANNTDYCLIIVKALSKNSDIKAYTKALEYVNGLDEVSIINISAGGNFFDAQESKLIKEMLDNKKTIIAAAGNNGENIDINHFYPASVDTRIIVVGNSNVNKVQETKNKGYSKTYASSVFGAVNTSNYGSEVDVFVNGVNRLSLGLQKNKIESLTGTSQSAAIFTGITIKDLIDKNLANKKARNK